MGLVICALGATDAAAADGRIEGRVVGSDGGPLPDVCLSVTRMTPEMGLAWHARTDTDGRYALDVSPGEFSLQFQSCADPNAWPTVYYGGGFDSPGDLLAVTEGESTTAADVRIPRFPSIFGQVTDTYGRPVAGACPKVRGHPDEASANYSFPMATGADGRFTIAPLLPNQAYKVAITDCEEAWSPRFDETWWRGPDLDAAEPVYLTEDDRAGVDFQVSLRGHISGTVTNDRGEPLEFVCVLGHAQGEESLIAFSRANGELFSRAVPPGSYVLRIEPCKDSPVPAPASYAPEYWNDQPTPATADPVALGTGVTPEIDVVLTADGPEPCTVPKLKGKRLRRATRKLAESDCAVGRVSETGEAGPQRVISSRPRRGSVRRHGAEVKLKVGAPDERNEPGQGRARF